MPSDGFHHPPLPRTVIHIYGIERTDTRRWGYRGPGKCCPSSRGLLEEMPELPSHNALEAQDYLCLDASGSSKSQVGGDRTGRWEVIRVWSEGCAAG